MVLEKKGTMMSELDYSKTCLLFFYIVILLAIDALNPVKIFLHVFPVVSPWHVASLAFCCMMYIFIASMRPLVYFASKVFFHSIMSIFFNDIQVVGLQNVPKYGPVIFTSNHANQFIDGMLIMCTCQRTISYLVAEKSWKRPVIGHLAWAMGAVPVKRAQDSARKGSGSITVSIPAGDSSEVKVVGRGTKFTQEIKPGDKIRFQKTALGITVSAIDGDETLTLKLQEGVLDVLSTQPFPEYVAYDILPHIDLQDTFKNVLEKLSSGGTIGIFPEGGSHDRTDLLPLKVGVSLIAYAQLDSGNNFPIIPVGLNYFRTHRFRGKATVEFGAPTYIDPSTLKDFRRGGSDKRRVCSELLSRIEVSMRSVIVSVPDYETLQVIHAARRLYRQDGADETAAQRQDMGRRFAEGYKRILLQTKGDPPEEWLSLQRRLLVYQKELNQLGIRDYQVAGLDHEEVEIGCDTQVKTETVLHRMKILGHICHLLAISALASLPAMLLNFPVGMASRIYSNRRRKVALAASKVKVKAYDVMLSERVLCCIILVPSLWMLYGLLLFSFTSLDGPSLAFCVACFPIFSYWSIMATESGMVDLKDLKPYVMRMIPSARKRLTALPATRQALQVDLRRMIRKIGPSLGTIYYEKEVSWKEIATETKRLAAEAVLGETRKDE